eukprot:3167230-Pleurochrysis_carterae.AAC.3
MRTHECHASVYVGASLDMCVRDHARMHACACIVACLQKAFGNSSRPKKSSAPADPLPPPQKQSSCMSRVEMR